MERTQNLHKMVETPGYWHITFPAMRRSQPKERTLKWPLGLKVVFGVALLVPFQLISFSPVARVLKSWPFWTIPEKPTPGIADHTAWCPSVICNAQNNNDPTVPPSINDSSDEQRVLPPTDDSSDSIDEPVEMKFAICAWVLNEAPYLSEWIEHHVAIGFDTIILHNDNSDDDTQCVIDAYADKGLVMKISEVNKKHLDGVDIIHQGRRPSFSMSEQCPFI